MRVLMLLVACVALACDSAPEPPAGPSTATATGAGYERVEARIVAMLLPARITHLARSGDGTIWWVQEGDDGRDVVFTLRDDGVPRASALTSARVVAALHPGEPIPAGAVATFHALAVDHGGRVWFYFVGGAGARSFTCIGTFNPADESVRISWDEAQLATATGMGTSLVLARGTLVPLDDGRALWLWLRHIDGSGLFRIDPATDAFTRPFETVTTKNGEPLTMTRPGLKLGTGPSGLLLLDPGRVELWRIDAAGRAGSVHHLIGLPTVLSAPAGDASGRTFFIAADAPLIPARTDEEALQYVLPARYPALLIVEDGTLRAVSRGDITLPEGISQEELRVQQLLALPGAQAFIGYDETSGALLRLQIVSSR